MATYYRNSLSPLPLYESIDEQLHRQSYSYGYIYPLYAHPNYLIPFFASWGVDPDSPDDAVKSIGLYQVCNCLSDKLVDSSLGDFNRDFSSDFSIGSIDSSAISIVRETKGDETYEALVFTGDESYFDLNPGQYYLVIETLRGRRFYSEVFTVIPEQILNEKTLELAWGDYSNLFYDGGFIPYEYSYRNRIYLPTQLGKPEYSSEEEGKERDGYFFPEKQISKKTHRFTALVSESLYDAMRIIGMSDLIGVSDPVRGRLSPVSFESDIEWLEDGYVAEAQCEFNTNTVIKTVGKPISL